MFKTHASKKILVAGLSILVCAIVCITLVQSSRSTGTSSLFQIFTGQALMYVVPARVNLQDYFEFRETCMKACNNKASAAVNECSADHLGHYYLKYRQDCLNEPCACEMLYMNCGCVYLLSFLSLAL